MEKIFGLPAHPLLVHLPVVLVPVVAICAVMLALRKDWRRRFGRTLVAASAVSCVAVFMAKQSGEALFELMQQAPDIRRHEQLSDTTMILTLLLFASIVGMVVMDRRNGNRKTSRLSMGLSFLSIGFAVLALVGTIATGHEGAKITWEQVSKGG